MGKASGRGAVLVHTVDTHRQMNRWDNLLEKHQRQLSREALSPLCSPRPSWGLLCWLLQCPSPLGIQPEKQAWAESAPHPAEPQLSLSPCS